MVYQIVFSTLYLLKTLYVGILVYYRIHVFYDIATMDMNRILHLSLQMLFLQGIKLCR